MDEKKSEINQDTSRFLTFFIDDECYGLNIAHVKEIIASMNITNVPKTPDYIKGVINLRGTVIPIVDVRLKFGMAEREYDINTAIVINEIDNANLDSKKVAIFGTGDQCSFPDSFVDSIGIIYEVLEKKACKVIGYVSTDGYDFTESKAVRDNRFVGLPIDEDNDPNKTDERIKTWTDSLISSFN